MELSKAVRYGAITLINAVTLARPVSCRNEVSMKKRSAIICATVCALGLTACGSDLGERMTTAALNTVIGMGTVFVVLIIIIGVISLFKFIPALQDRLAKKKAEEAQAESGETALETVSAQEDAELTDDLELVAVIAAAIAASEGAASADGFVVRSIRKANRVRRA